MEVYGANTTNQNVILNIDGGYTTTGVWFRRAMTK